jgi:DNA-binding winged helix-turn-helix (wHTH) protein
MVESSAPILCNAATRANARHLLSLSPSCPLDCAARTRYDLDVNRLLRFGSFEADLTTRELKKMGVPVAVPPQPFDILAILLERPGMLVTRQELRARLWPDAVFVDFDHGLNKAVSKLREVLGDDGAKPRFVETLPRRGYRFITPVSSQSMEIAGPVTVARLLYEGRTAALSPGAHVVGRDKRSAVYLDSPSVSREHARVTVSADAASIEDLDSKNGTRVNGKEILGVTGLEDGDQIQIGLITLTFRNNQGTSTETIA